MSLPQLMSKEKKLEEVINQALEAFPDCTLVEQVPYTFKSTGLPDLHQHTFILLKDPNNHYRVLQSRNTAVTPLTPEEFSLLNTENFTKKSLESYNNLKTKLENSLSPKKLRI